MAYAVRYYGLIADTLAPLIVIAMAIPFAIAGIRVNPAVGVSKSIGLFFLYYVLAQFQRSDRDQAAAGSPTRRVAPERRMAVLGDLVFCPAAVGELASFSSNYN